MFDAFFVVGLFLVPIGIIALGVAMLGAPALGKGFGGMSVVVGVVAATVLLVDPQSPMAFVGVLALIVFNLVVGSKVYGLSRAS